TGAAAAATEGGSDRCLPGIMDTSPFIEAGHESQTTLSALPRRANQFQAIVDRKEKQPATKRAGSAAIADWPPSPASGTTLLVQQLVQDGVPALGQLVHTFHRDWTPFQ